MKPPSAACYLASSKWLAALLGLCTLGSFPSAAAEPDQLKVAVVDMAKVFSGYYKTHEANQQIDEARDIAKKEIDRRMEIHHRLLEEIAQTEKDLAEPSLSEAARADRQHQRESKTQEIHALEAELAEFKDTRDRSLREQTARARGQIVEDIMVVVNARVERDHDDLILNKSAQGLGGKTLVLHADDHLEITADVIAALNRNHPVPVGTPTPSPGR